MTEASLKILREKLKDKDEAIIKLLNERASLSIEIGSVKQRKELDIYDPAQEHTLYSQIVGMNRGPLPETSLKWIYREILSASRALQEPTTVAYLGPKESFTHEAARSQFGMSAYYTPQPSILDVFHQVERGHVRLGVVPAANSLEGPVKVTLDRLLSTPLRIMAEIFLPIRHSLISKRADRQGIKRIYSHPQALAQCQSWIREHIPGCSLHETESTTKAAVKVLEDDEAAAIGSAAAASTYGLTVIAERIEDHPNNTTRFLVIGNGKNRPTGRDKTSILYGTRHEPGALYNSLRSFAEREINLLSIISHPIKDRMWEYLFFVDFSGHEEEPNVEECLAELGHRCTFVKVLGSYPDSSLSFDRNTRSTV
ncbi:MAG: prephenate dehydratase [Deltaproteobacteria bacterium]|nr:prephenate dehydratase [Deltaproteobacteria bacterium]